MPSDKDRDNYAWWENDGATPPHEKAIGLIEKLKADQTIYYQELKRLNAHYARGSRGYHGRKGGNRLDDDVITINYARGVIDTVHVKLLKTRISPTPQTIGADFLAHENAEHLGQALDGEFSRNKVQKILDDVLLDGLNLGDGFFYVPHGLGEIKVEYLPCEDVLVDESECRYRQPCNLYIRRLIDRDKLLAQYGVKNESYYGSIKARREGIKEAAQRGHENLLVSSYSNDVEVWLAYHLPSGPEEEDGRYAVIVDGCTLEFTDWTRQGFPVAHFSPMPGRRSYHGDSMLAELIPMQKEYDKVTKRLQQSNHLNGGTHLLANRAANLSVRNADNGQGTIWEYDDTAGGKAVDQFNPAIANPQVFEYRSGILNEMLQRFGIPSMTMTGRPPEGMRDASGRALEQADEQTAERLVVMHSARDQVVIDLGWLIIEEAEAIVEDDPSYSVNAKNADAKGLSTVKWKDVLLARDKFELHMAVSSDLAKNPGAKFNQLMQLFNAKAISVDELRAQWRIVDIEAANELYLADETIIMKVLAQMIRDGRPRLPESFDNLQLVVSIGRKFYNLARAKEVEPPNLQLVRDYVARAQALLDAANAATAAQQLATAPAPGVQGPVPGSNPQTGM